MPGWSVSASSPWMLEEADSPDQHCAEFPASYLFGDPLIL